MQKQQGLRRESRDLILMPGQMLTQLSLKAYVAVTDLSPHGCRVIARAEHLCLSETVYICMDNLEPWSARLRWRDFQIAGLEFDRPLYPPVVDHLVSNWQRAPALASSGIFGEAEADDGAVPSGSEPQGVGILKPMRQASYIAVSRGHSPVNDRS